MSSTNGLPLFALFSLALAPTTHAQTVVGAPRPCELAYQSLRTLPFPTSARGDARLAPRCGATGGVELGKALKAARLETDTLRLDALTSGLTTFADAEVLTAALIVAKDQTASISARVFAMRSMLGAVAPGSSATYGGLTARDQSSGLATCSVDGTGDGSVSLGATPLNAASRITTDLNAIAASPEQPQAVRAAAKCILGVVTASSGRVLPSANVAQIQLAYECGNNFRVSNPTPAGFTLVYDVPGTTIRGTIDALNQDGTQPPEDTFFGVAANGTVRLLYRDQVIQTAANGGTSCTQ